MARLGVRVRATRTAPYTKIPNRQPPNISYIRFLIRGNSQSFVKLTELIAGKELAFSHSGLFHTIHNVVKRFEVNRLTSYESGIVSKERALQNVLLLANPFDCV